MDTNPRILERQANLFLSEKQYSQAFQSFDRTANLYSREGNHKQAALCFASAASCWGMQCGEKRFYKAAISYERAAGQAEASGDLEYAFLLYRYAAINYERDGEFHNLSKCTYRSKECYRKFLTYHFFNPGRIHPIIATKQKKGAMGAIKSFFQWFLLTFSFLIWGYGEMPFRAFCSGVIVVFLSSIFYSLAYLLKGDLIFRPNFFEALYFSVVTFTTVGYGDLAPIGFSRLIASFECFCGIFIMPIFVISLAKKYLRI